jgi:hypothetical protein
MKALQEYVDIVPHKKHRFLEVSVAYSSSSFRATNYDRQLLANDLKP